MLNASLSTINTSYRSYLVFYQPQKMSTFADRREWRFVRGSLWSISHRQLVQTALSAFTILSNLDIHHVRQPKYGWFSLVAKTATKEDDRSQVSLIQQSFAYSGDARWNDATV